MSGGVGPAGRPAPQSLPRPRRTATGRADLARLIAALPPERVTCTAAVLGFVAVDVQVEQVQPRHEPGPLGADDIFGSVVAAPRFSWGLGQMTFTAESRPQRWEQRADTSPLTQDDLTSPGRSLLATPRTAPLAPWSRLWPALRAVLQSSAPGRDPDVAALLRSWGRGEVVGRVPRLRRRAWAARAALWVDRSARLTPFWSDQVDVYRRLHAACGQSGLTVRLLDAQTQAWALRQRGHLLASFRPDPETPILVLGDLGIYGSPAERAAWLGTARRLRRAGVQIAALLPAAPARWDNTVARAWAAVPWERGHTTAVARHPPEVWQQRVERLLRLTAPAALVQPGLLRALRRLLPAAAADASTEADAFRHADVRAADATGLVLKSEAALRRRQEFADQEPAALKVRVSATIRRWHEGLPTELLRIETLAWLALVAPEVAPPPGDRDDALEFAQRLEVSVAQGLADSLPAATVRRCARTMLLAMPAAAYEKIPALQLIWAAAFAGVSDVQVPAGLDPAALYAKLGREAIPSWWGAREIDGCLRFSRSSNSAWPSQESGPGSPVAWLLAAESHLFVQRGAQAFETQLVLRPGLSIPLNAGEALVLRSDRSTLTIAGLRLEPWALASGQDRFGLWAEAEVRGVGLRFRWIPPGRFPVLPPDLGADHEADEEASLWTTRTQGFWLADAPCTQALWTAVMGENPSRFVSPERPVEHVSWDDCQEFLRRLDMLAPYLEARLPTEEEWEHACRAGTMTTTWRGDPEILGPNDAPGLDAIAWYSGNCGVDFELTSGAALDWPDKQYAHTQGGTHPVRQREPNPFGLFDMLGNVDEYCLDLISAEMPDTTLDPTARGLRGGSWSSPAGHLGAGARFATHRRNRSDSIGFRLARDVGGPPAPIYRLANGSYSAVAGSGVIIADTCGTRVTGPQLETPRNIRNDGNGNITIYSADGAVIIGTGPVRRNKGVLSNGPVRISDGTCFFAANYTVHLTVTGDNAFEMRVTQVRSGSFSEVGQNCQQPSTCSVTYQIAYKML